MKKTILILSIFLVGCFGKSQMQEISEILKKIGSEYDTNITYEIGKRYKFNKATKFIKIKVQLNGILKQYKDHYDLPASNIAVNFSKQMKNHKYDEINIEFYDHDKMIYNKVFKKNDLDIIISKLKVFNKINSLLIRQEYDKIFDLFDSKYIINFNKNEFITIFQNFDNELGKPIKIVSHGFTYEKQKINNKEIFYIANFEMVKREKEDTKLSIYIDKLTNKIISIKFDW